MLHKSPLGSQKGERADSLSKLEAQPPYKLLIFRLKPTDIEMGNLRFELKIVCVVYFVNPLLLGPVRRAQGNGRDAN